MYQILTIIVCFVLSTLSGCTSSSISVKKIETSQDAKALVIDTLHVASVEAVEELKGGYSGAKIFKVLTPLKTYVVRSIAHKSPAARQQEIECQYIASQGEYGPLVYYADNDAGVIIMEFLKNESISIELRKQSVLYQQLAEVLRRLHEGGSFPVKFNVFDEIRRTRCIENVKNIITLSHALNDGELVKFADEVEVVIKKFPHESPCHNDLNTNNIMFSNGVFKIIDYESAGQSDPYYDIATFVNYYCFNAKHERELFTAYLGHKPNKKELAKLRIMKHVALLNCGLQIFKYVHPNVLNQTFTMYTLTQNFERLVAGIFDQSSLSDLYQGALSMLSEVACYANSEDYVRDRKTLIG